MSIMAPHCFNRRCRHYQGVKWMGEEETSEQNICTAFPRGIPVDIAYGNNLHLSPVPGDHGIQYEHDDGTNELYRPNR